MKWITVIDHGENDNRISGPKKFVDSGNRGRRRKHLMKVLKHGVVKGVGP
jgi:hypothetical protein